VRPEDVQGQGETVLVVEDDDMVRRLARVIIERAGYQVVEATSPDEALRLAERGDVSIDVLLTDVIMPAMNGRELAKRILVRRPEVKVVFTSGYTDDVIAHHGVLDRGVSLVQKPFSASSLTAKVRAVLDGKEPGGVGAS
jgi:DNA-binding response OmpR family regulator